MSLLLTRPGSDGRDSTQHESHLHYVFAQTSHPGAKILSFAEFLRCNPMKDYEDSTVDGLYRDGGKLVIQEGRFFLTGVSFATKSAMARRLILRSNERNLTISRGEPV
jgi:hypothetical protein